MHRFWRSSFFLCSLFLPQIAACGPRTVGEAERRRDIRWLTANTSGDATAALGRLADTEPKAQAALEARPPQDLDVYIAAWAAVTRNAGWGSSLIRAALADPARAEIASSALPRKDVHLVPFIADLENAMLKMSTGTRGRLIAGVLASIGPPAHAAVEHRLVDSKTRGLMCDGIGMPEASSDAKAILLAVSAEARDAPSCVTAVVDIARTEDPVLDWIASTGEPGLLGIAAKSTLPCPRVATMWNKALATRGVDAQAAMTVPLERSIERCATELDPILAGLLTKAPRARPTIIQAIDPYGTGLANMKETCGAFRRGYANGENALARERVHDALRRGCTFAR